MGFLNELSRGTRQEDTYHCQTAFKGELKQKRIIEKPVLSRQSLVEFKTLFTDVRLEAR